MSLEQNKELVRRSVAEFYNRKNLAAVDEIYAADYVLGPTACEAMGVDGLVEYTNALIQYTTCIP